MAAPAAPAEILASCPLFSHLGAQTAARIVPHFRRAFFDAGQDVFRSGAPGDALHVIGSGRVKVWVDGPRGGEVVFATLGAGEHFGEIALFTGEPRSATVSALEPTVTWTLDREGFRSLLKSEPALEQYFQSVVAHASIRTFLIKSTVLAHASPEALCAFMAALKPLDLEAGQLAFCEGDAPSHFYIVREGRLRVFRQSGDARTTIGTLGPGDHFGEMGIVGSSPRSASVVAEERTRLFTLTASEFERILGDQRGVRRELESRIEAFRKAMRAGVSLDAAAPAAPARGPRPAAGTARGPFGFARTPFLEQAEELDAAACCLSMVSTYYGVSSALAPLRDLVNITKEGATLLSIAQAAEQIGFAAWPEKELAADELARVQLPAIAQWEGSHWVVVHRADAARYVVTDPAIGVRHLTREEFQAGYTGEAVVLLPGKRIRKLEGAGIGFRYFAPLIRPFLPVLGEVLLCALLLTAFGLAVPVFTSTVVDSVMVRGSTSMLVIMLVGMLIVNTCQLWTRSLESFLTLYVSSRIDVGLVVKFYRHVLRLPVRYFDVRKAGDILARFGENEHVRQLFTGTPLAAILNLITVAVYLTLMSFFNLKLTLALLAYIPLYVLVTMFASPIMRRLASEAFARQAQASGFLIESVTGIQTVKAAAIEQPVRWRWQNTFIDASGRNLKRELGDGGLEISSGFIESLSSATLLYFGALQVMANQLTVGQLMAFYSMIGMVMGPIGTLLGMWDEIQRGLMGLERIGEVLAFDEEQPPAARAKAKVLPPFTGHLVFDHVTFSYDPKGGRKHLDDVTFEAKPGEMIAVVGRSGAGKTTLAAVLLRMREPLSGRVLIDGHDLAGAELTSLRRQIGVVMQENFLFAGTIRENICPDDPGAPMDGIIHAATLAGAHDFISQLPMGYDTAIGERGAGLSGGQRQRVAIARCLYRDPRVLIFDEATSALDTESERVIQQNMAKFLRGRTSIVIAHRLSTVRAAHKILVMDSGRVVEVGTHHELMAQRGIYYCLNTQSVRED